MTIDKLSEDNVSVGCPDPEGPGPGAAAPSLEGPAQAQVGTGSQGLRGCLGTGEDRATPPWTRCWEETGFEVGITGPHCPPRQGSLTPGPKHGHSGSGQSQRASEPCGRSRVLVSRPSADP